MTLTEQPRTVDVHDDDGPSKVADRKVKRISVFGALRRVWLPLVIVAVVAVAGFCVHRLQGVFGVHDHGSQSNSAPEDIKPFNPKHVVYEVFGPPGTVANINYLDIKAQPQRVDNAPLPWTLSVTTTLPSVSVNIVAQGDSDEIGCRIIVNGVVKDERIANELNAQTFCLVKSG
jgi:nitrate reductase NapE component